MKENKGTLRKLSDRTARLQKSSEKVKKHLKALKTDTGCDAYITATVKPLLEECFTTQGEVGLVQILKDTSLEDADKVADLEAELAAIAGNLASTDGILPAIFRAASATVGKGSA